MEKFTNLQRSTTSITVVNQIIDMIANGELRAGEKLPSENAVSRTAEGWKALSPGSA